MQPGFKSRWQDLQQLPQPDKKQLDRIEIYLDLVLIALMAIAELDSEALLQAAEDLNLTVTVGDRPIRWQQSGANKALEEDEARSLVLMICYLAKQHQELIRRAVSLLEIKGEQQEAERVTLLKDYLNKFIVLYRAKFTERSPVTIDLSQLAWKLLTDLLFYSSDIGHRLLWLAALNAAG